jgi:diacylglycerol kinase family enzyme
MNTHNPSIHVAVIVNGKAGSVNNEQLDDERRVIQDTFIRHGATADVLVVEGANLVTIAQECAERTDIQAVVAVGGDGTISAVASGLVGGRMPLGVLPRGTLNHFSKDNNIPQDLNEAVALIVNTLASGTVRRVDVGEVNGRTFINNSAIGMYPQTVAARDAYREKLGISKWFAMTIAAIKILRRFPLHRVRLHTADGSVSERVTPLVFIGNNEYNMDISFFGQRDSTREGVLCVYIVRSKTRWGMIRLCWQILRNRVDVAEEFEALTTTDIILEVRKKARPLMVSMDGEVIKMAAPLCYRIRPKALLAIVPLVPTQSFMPIAQA